LHDAGPEIKRAISGNLDELIDDNPEPSHRVFILIIHIFIVNKFENIVLKRFINLKRNHTLFGSVWSSMRRRTGSLRRSFRVSNTHSKKKHVRYSLDRLLFRFLIKLDLKLTVFMLSY